MRFRNVSRECWLAVLRLELDCFFLLWGAFIVRLWFPGSPGLLSYLFLGGGLLLVPLGFGLWLSRTDGARHDTQPSVWYWPGLIVVVLLIVEGLIVVEHSVRGLPVLPTGVALGGCLIVQGRALVFLAKRL